MYIDGWRQTRSSTTVFEAAVNDHFGILCGLDEVVLHTSSFLTEQQRRMQIIARITEVANTTLCGNWANRSSPSFGMMCLANPARCKCVAHLAVIREFGAFANDAMQTISVMQTDL